MWGNGEFYDVFYGKNLCALFRKYISNVADGSDGATFSDTRKKSFKKLNTKKKYSKLKKVYQFDEKLYDL